MRVALAFAGAGCLLSGPASAHMAVVGLGPFYDGLAHPFLTPSHLLPILALSIMGALAGARTGRVLVTVMPVIWLAAGLLGSSLPREPSLPGCLGAITLALGVLAASAAPLSIYLFGVVASVASLTDGAEARASGQGLPGVLGIVASVVAISSLVAGHGLRLRGAAARTGLRVAGSWIGAVGLLTLGWSIRGS